MKIGNSFLTVYWILFAYCALGTLLSADQVKRHSASSLFLFCGVLGIVLIVGLRFEVGGDWNAYKHMFSHMAYVGIGKALSVGDFGYQLLNWVARNLGAGLWVVNLTCASIFGWGLWRFAKIQQAPWLTLLVAVPYLVIVVAMGYTRQAVAIGFILAGLAALQRGVSPIHFAGYVIGAARQSARAEYRLEGRVDRRAGHPVEDREDDPIENVHIA